LRVEVDERTMSDGRVLRRIDGHGLRLAYARLLKEGAESVAICFINSYVSPENEREARRVIEEVEAANDRLPITISSDVTREWREYERTSTAVLNAYVMPVVDSYISKLMSSFRSMKFGGAFYMMLSSGGVATFEFVKRVPIATVESGPVAGVVAGTKIAEAMGERNVIVLDGGSTTTKASLVEDLGVRFTSNYAVEKDEYNPGYPVKVPVVDIVEIGNGGGSIAWVDELGNLRVGPTSAGAVPGPASYGKGGREPTVTDAYLAVGFLNPSYFLGGQFSLDPELDRNSLLRIAKDFGISVEEAAFAVIRLANDNAAQILRLISVQRGYDPRDFALIAHGGSGPMLSAFIAEELEIPRVIVPAIPAGNFSAWGLLMSDLKYDATKTVVSKLDSPGIMELFERGYAELAEEALLLAGRRDAMLARFADLRYYGQEHTIRVSVPSTFSGRADVDDIARRFGEQHAREYGFTLGNDVELVNLHIAAVVPTKKPAIKEFQVTGSVGDALKAKRNVFWGNAWQMSRIYERQRLPPKAEVKGPAVIEEPTTTTLVKEGYKATTDRFGNLVLEAGS
jgi:N-methylhydantoinase A